MTFDEAVDVVLEIWTQHGSAAGRGRPPWFASKPEVAPNGM